MRWLLANIVFLLSVAACMAPVPGATGSVTPVVSPHGSAAVTSPEPGPEMTVTGKTDSTVLPPVTPTRVTAVPTLVAAAVSTNTVSGPFSVDSGHFEPADVEEPATAVDFAVIGDYGLSFMAGERAVADLVKGWKPDLIITVGDNNYPAGAAETIDMNIGQFYHEYIHPYQGEYGSGAMVNRFFPTLGNHDWLTDEAQAYLDYLSLPGNERYYDFVWGPVHFFALDSDEREPDGAGPDSIQARWLQEEMASSTECWQVVYFHHPPYSSGLREPVTWMRWPFAEWGADAVLSGHDHVYERVMVEGIPYFVNGLGGTVTYSFGATVPGSEVQYNEQFGAMRAAATQEQITFEFIAADGTVVDSYTLSGGCIE